MFKNVTNIFIAIILIASCGTKSTDIPLKDANAESNDKPVMEVSVTKALRSDFPTYIISQGNLEAVQKIDLVWAESGYITALNVKDGDWVEENKILARLSSEAYLQELKQANINLEKAKLSREDMLISGSMDTSTDYSEKLNNIDVLSGYKQALFDIQKAELKISNQKITAPFSGIIYNVNQAPGSFAASGSVFGKLINTKNFNIKFEILESELGKVKIGQAIEVSAMTGQFATFTSSIHHILPTINDNGLVTIVAKSKDLKGELFDGIKVQVKVNQLIKDQIIVPKEAIVVRAGREVIFTVDESLSVAKWNYVKTANENENQICIIEGINAGDIIIVDGNLNLSNDARIKVNKELGFK